MISVRSIWFTETTLIRKLILKNDRVYSVETKKKQVPERALIREREQAAKVSRYQLVCLHRRHCKSQIFIRLLYPSPPGPSTQN